MMIRHMKHVPLAASVNGPIDFSVYLKNTGTTRIWSERPSILALTLTRLVQNHSKFTPNACPLIKIY